MNKTKIRSHLSGRDVRPLELKPEQVGEFASLGLLGINLDEPTVRQMMGAMDSFGFAMDDLQPTVFPNTIGTPIQFLQNWLPGFVRAITAARTADELIGISAAGSWEDEEIVQGVLEPTGKAVPYGDYTNIPLSSWNPSFERRTVVRLEQGMRVGKLEEARAARMNANTAAEKRTGATISLEIARNRIAFYGYNSGANRTYGILNDPSLPAYVTVPNGTAGTPQWSTKTFLEITADIRGILASLRTTSGNTIDPNKAPITLGVAAAAVDYMTVTSQYGNSVWDWLKTTYPNVRVVAVPEFNAANGGANVLYAFADRVEDGSSDGGATWGQFVPAKFQLLGIEKQAKAYVEDYVAATAGAMLKRPYAIARRSGI